MANTILGIPAAQTQSGYSRSTIYLRITQGLWPRQISLGPRAIGWPATEIEALNAARISGKTDDEIRLLVLKLESARKAAVYPEPAMSPKPRPDTPQTPLDFNSSRSIPMNTTTTAATAATATTPAAATASAPPSQPLTSASAALKSLRLPPNYGATLGVKKLLTLVPVGKPKKPQFFRTHTAPEMTFAAMLLEQKESRESYVVMPDVAQEVSELVRPVQLHAAIDRQNNVFLIPVSLPGEDGTRNPWHESLAQAVEHAKLKWLRITANMHAGGYDVYEAEGALPEPEWPAHDIDALVEVAFRGKIITSLDHPVIQTLLGKI